MCDASESPRNRRWVYVGRGARLLFWLFVFALSIKLIEQSFKTMSSQIDLAALIARSTANPIEAVCIGILITVMAQSSSLTTSILVTMVATDLISLHQAIPVIMGANVGTTIKSNFVATAHVARREEFRLAFSAGTVHDVFNLLTLAIMLPIECVFGVLEKLSSFMMIPLTVWYGEGGGEMSKGPFNAVVTPIVESIQGLLVRLTGDNVTLLGVGLFLVALVFLVSALLNMVRLLRQIFSKGAENFLDEVLFKRWWSALLFGVILTAIVQSSSLTVSLMVPLVASGVLTLERAFPMALGANIGTTVTAFMAALVTGRPEAVALALTHLFFNFFGAAVFLPLRKIPISIAKALATRVYANRWFALYYVSAVFIVFPVSTIAIIELFIN